MNNFLTRSVRVQVRNNRNKSLDSPPCCLFVFLPPFTVVLLKEEKVLHFESALVFTRRSLFPNVASSSR